MFKDLYPASMNDIQMWNIRELRLCLEWAKTFEEFQRLSDNDQVLNSIVFITFLVCIGSLLRVHLQHFEQVFVLFII